MKDDAISKAAAIGALWKALYEYEDKTEKQFQESKDLDVGDWIGHRIFVQNMNDIDRQTILNLPSAQPDLDEWCTDCAEYDHDRHCCPRFNRVIREALNDVTTFHWTPVEDAHPIKSGPYLACSERGTVFTVFWLGNRWGTEGVIAWAEQPKPYRKEEKHD